MLCVFYYTFFSFCSVLTEIPLKATATKNPKILGKKYVEKFIDTLQKQNVWNN